MRADNGRRSDFEIFRAREMRRYPTDAERKLWQLLRGKHLGVRFRRQQPIGPFVVDFYCSPARLIVELDGERHGFDARRKYDERRAQWLEQHGYRVVRFWNADVVRNEESVIEQILTALVECGGKRRM